MLKKSKLKIQYNITDELLLQAIELDKLVFDKQDVGTIEKCKQWLSINNEIYTMLTLENQVIGYINFFPITRECYELFKSGKFKDYNIENNNILPFTKDTDLFCLFTSIVIHPRHQNSKAIIYLWNGFMDKLKKMKENGIRIKSVIMDCVTSIGVKCAKTYLNGKYICNSINGQIFEGNFEIF